MYLARLDSVQAIIKLIQAMLSVCLKVKNN
jgi:hypothetical protein